MTKEPEEIKVLTKDTRDTKEAVCLLSGENVSIDHRCLEVPGRPGDRAFLRIDSFNCTKANSCGNPACVGRVRTGTVRNWKEQDS